VISAKEETKGLGKMNRNIDTQPDIEVIPCSDHLTVFLALYKQVLGDPTRAVVIYTTDYPLFVTGSASMFCCSILGRIQAHHYQQPEAGKYHNQSSLNTGTWIVVDVTLTHHLILIPPAGKLRGKARAFQS